MGIGIRNRKYRNIGNLLHPLPFVTFFSQKLVSGMISYAKCCAGRPSLTPDWYPIEENSRAPPYAPVNGNPYHIGNILCNRRLQKKTIIFFVFLFPPVSISATNHHYKSLVTDQMKKIRFACICTIYNFSRIMHQAQTFMDKNICYILDTRRCIEGRYGIVSGVGGWVKVW